MNTQALETRIGKNHNGWEAVTCVHINDVKMLRIASYKGNRGVKTSATAVEIDGNTTMTMIGQDFSKSVMSNPNVRCTRNAVEKQHQEVLDVHITELLNEAIRHYQ